MPRAVKKRTSESKSAIPGTNDRGTRALARNEADQRAAEVIFSDEALEVFIPGEPVAWARPIPTNRGGLTPEKQRRHRTLLQVYLRRAYGSRPAIPAGIPVSVEMQFIFPAGKKKPGTYKATRADLDNLGKLVLDAMQGSHAPLILSDDGQVSFIIMSKTWGETPGTFVKWRIIG